MTMSDPDDSLVTSTSTLEDIKDDHDNASSNADDDDGDLQIDEASNMISADSNVSDDADSSMNVPTSDTPFSPPTEAPDPTPMDQGNENEISPESPTPDVDDDVNVNQVSFEPVPDGASISSPTRSNQDDNIDDSEMEKTSPPIVPQNNDDDMQIDDSSSMQSHDTNVTYNDDDNSAIANTSVGDNAINFIDEPKSPVTDTPCSPCQDVQSPDPTQDVQSPDPTQDVQSPDPSQDVQSPDPSQDVQSPDPSPMDQDMISEIRKSPISLNQVSDSASISSPIQNQDDNESPSSPPQGTDDISSPPPDQDDDTDMYADLQDKELTDVVVQKEKEIASPQNQNNDSCSQDTGDGPGSPISNGGLYGTPISIEESQSQSSPPDTPIKKDKDVNKNKPKTEEINEEDLEDGEIATDEEEDGDEAKETKAPAPPPKDKDKSSSKSKERSKDKDKKDKHSKSDKKKVKESKEELDPIKRLLAEVKEKDNKEKEEREKRRQERKRSKKDEKESSGSKKKKKKLSDEEDEGEEFLFVRGASPGAGGENWEEFGDDKRNKRRRDSEEGSSPSHRHRRGQGQEGNASPVRARPTTERPKARPERREPPKSDVICAYFMQGKCQKSSEACTFSHDAVPPRKMELCKFWMMECCAKKEKCLYLHNDFPCKYFHTGLVCRMGDRCKFSHQPLSDVTKQVLLKHIETAPKEILGDFPRLNRTGALNLINKMEAKLQGLPYDEEPVENEMMNQGPPHHGHNDRHNHPGDRHQGPPPDHRHGHQDRHGHDRLRDNNRGNYNDGPNHHNENNSRGRGHDRGGNRDRGGPGPDQNHGRGPGGDRRQSRWEQQQPTRGDQEKLQELMNEAGISGFYKDTLETGGNNNSGQQQQMPNPQSQLFPPQLANMQPPLLPMLPGFLPQMLPQNQGLPQVNNPALASVLASLNIPSSTIVPPNLPPQFTLDTPPPTSHQHINNKKDDSIEGQDIEASNNTAIPDNLPKMQRELFKRIQQQQLKNESKVQTQERSEPEEPEENWYSDEEEEDSKKKEELKAEINDQISSVLNQIRQQSQQQQQQAPKPKESETLKTFFGDTDLRSSVPSSDFKDVDLRTNNMFKKINIVPATEINASLASHGPVIYRAIIVAGLRDKPDYTQIRQSLTPQQILLDPRFTIGGGKQRSNSIPAPESPTEQSTDIHAPSGISPVFDPRTMKGGNPGRGLLDTPPMFTDNMPPGMHMNDFNPFNRDPRGGQQNNVPQNSASAAQNLALAQNFAAAAALMQQWPNNGQQIDPNLLMLASAGFPFLPQPPVTNSNQSQNPPMDFNMMGNAGMRMRPPFNLQQPPPQHQPPPSSSWERFSQQGQGGLSPPL